MTYRGLPEQDRLLYAISGGEATDYNQMYGHTPQNPRTFSDYSDHPRQKHLITSGPNAGQYSSAAGLFQFIAPTWDRVKQEAGLPDFTPPSQRAGAWHLANQTYAQKTGRDLLSDMQAGDYKYIGPALSSEWTSIPGGIEPNPATNKFYQRLQGGPMNQAFNQAQSPKSQEQLELEYAQQRGMNSGFQGPVLGANFIAGGPGALYAPEPQVAQQPQVAQRPADDGGFFGQENRGNIGMALQNAGAFLQSINNPAALSIVAANNRIAADKRVKSEGKFGTFQGKDGRTYIINEKDGSYRPVVGDSSRPYPTTPGDIKVDQEYAKDYAEWVAGGEIAGINNNLRKLEVARANLMSSDNISGPIAGLRNMLPDPLNAMLGGEKSISTREGVQDVIMQSLRQILGSQFTEKEGTALMARTYNPSLSEAENIRRLDLLKDKILQMAADKQAASNYYRQHETLKGYSGRPPMLEDIRSFDFIEKKQQPQQAQPQGGVRPPLSSYLSR